LKMKNIGMIFAVAALLFVSLIVPFSSTEAAYELLGRRTTNTYSSYYDAFMTSNVQSTGGWLGINSEQSGVYDVYEYDPNNGDDFIGVYSISSSEFQEVYVDNYVDGSNNRAEIYLVSSYSGDSFVLYD
jgi:hypothetical protein